MVFVRGRGVKGIRLDKINSAAPHNPSGLSHEVRVTVTFPKALGAAVRSRVMDARSGSIIVFVYLKYL